VVVPFYNEAEAIPRLCEEIRAALDALDGSAEAVLVDDGSSDRSAELLAAEAAADPRFRVLTNRANRGQASALLRGFRAARGGVIATLDGDGQNDPADLPRLLDLLASSDMVVGVRTDRRDAWLRRVMSRLANGVRGVVLGDGMRDAGCAAKVFRREVLVSFLPIRSLYSFMPALARASGFRIVQTPVRHRPRLGGRSSYGIRRFAWRPLLDMFGVLWFIHRRCPVDRADDPAY
jgi:dolichol-phosphate mannosyltransferase